MLFGIRWATLPVLALPPDSRVSSCEVMVIKWKPASGTMHDAEKGTPSLTLCRFLYNLLDYRMPALAGRFLGPTHE